MAHHGARHTQKKKKNRQNHTLLFLFITFYSLAHEHIVVVHRQRLQRRCTIIDDDLSYIALPSQTLVQSLALFLSCVYCGLSTHSH